MIAKLTYTDGDGVEQTATLHEDARWEATDPAIGAALNDRIAGESRSPARGDWLLGHARHMAGVLEATLEIEGRESGPPDARY